MKLQEAILNNLNEKASIDWNNFLTKEQVRQFMSKDDKVESAENIIYSNEFKSRAADLNDDLQKKYNNAYTKRELVQDLVDFYEKGHLIAESSEELWKSQINRKNKTELLYYVDRLYNKLDNYEQKEIKTDEYYNLIKQIEYVENRLGRRGFLGRELG